MTKPTENELFEITNFEKWFKESRYNDEYYDIALSGWQARAELADKEIAELQAQINELREVLKELQKYDVDVVFAKICVEALAKTAPQCLQKIEAKEKWESDLISQVTDPNQ